MTERPNNNLNNKKLRELMRERISIARANLNLITVELMSIADMTQAQCLEMYSINAKSHRFAINQMIDWVNYQHTVDRMRNYDKNSSENDLIYLSRARIAQPFKVNEESIMHHRNQHTNLERFRAVVLSGYPNVQFSELLSRFPGEVKIYFPDGIYTELPNKEKIKILYKKEIQAFVKQIDKYTYDSLKIIVSSLSEEVNERESSKSKKSINEDRNVNQTIAEVYGENFLLDFVEILEESLEENKPSTTEVLSEGFESLVLDRWKGLCIQTGFVILASLASYGIFATIESAVTRQDNSMQYISTELIALAERTVNFQYGYINGTFQVILHKSGDDITKEHVTEIVKTLDGMGMLTLEIETKKKVDNHQREYRMDYMESIVEVIYNELEVNGEVSLGTKVNNSEK